MLRIRTAALCVSLLASPLTVSAGAATDKPEPRLQALEPYFHTYRPDGPGPFPAVLFAPGCYGFSYRDSAQAYADLAESWRIKGYVVVFVDYIKSRGEQICDGETPDD